MARKASSKKSEAQTPPPDLPFTPATPMPSRPATPTPSRPKTKFPKTQAPQPPQAPPPDVGETSAQGLLQLSFARHAHGYGILGAVALLLNTILLLSLGSQPPFLPAGIRVDFILSLL